MMIKMWFWKNTISSSGAFLHIVTLQQQTLTCSIYILYDRSTLSSIIVKQKENYKNAFI